MKPSSIAVAAIRASKVRRPPDFGVAPEQFVRQARNVRTESPVNRVSLDQAVDTVGVALVPGADYELVRGALLRDTSMLMSVSNQILSHGADRAIRADCYADCPRSSRRRRCRRDQPTCRRREVL